MSDCQGCADREATIAALTRELKVAANERASLVDLNERTVKERAAFEHQQWLRIEAAETTLAAVRAVRDTWDANSDKYKKLHVADVVADIDRALAALSPPAPTQKKEATDG